MSSIEKRVIKLLNSVAMQKTMMFGVKGLRLEEREGEMPNFF